MKSKKRVLSYEMYGDESQKLRANRKNFLIAYRLIRLEHQYVQDCMSLIARKYQNGSRNGGGMFAEEMVVLDNGVGRMTKMFCEERLFRAVQLAYESGRLADPNKMLQMQ